MLQNRIVNSQADYLFLIVRKPEGWEPSRIEEVPRGGKVLSQQFVASYAEAYDDLVRCNKLALDRGLDKWAVIQALGGYL